MRFIVIDFTARRIHGSRVRVLIIYIYTIAIRINRAEERNNTYIYKV